MVGVVPKVVVLVVETTSPRHMTPASSVWLHTVMTQPWYWQSAILCSLPAQSTPRRNIGPVPGGYTPPVTALAIPLHTN